MVPCSFGATEETTSSRFPPELLSVGPPIVGCGTSAGRGARKIVIERRNTVSADRYGARIARTTYEPCTVCGSYVTLTEGTRTGLSEDGDFELHLTEECEHHMTRVVMVWRPPSQAEETFSA